MTELAQDTCAACSGSIPALNEAEVEELRAEVDQWEVEQGHRLARTFTFPDFAQALAFVNRIGAIAEDQGHHPEVRLGWGWVRVEIWTHKVDGLTKSDFILAAKIDDARRRS